MCPAELFDDLDERARRGDASAATEICRRLRAPLERFAFRYLGDSHESEDVVQDAIAALLEADSWPRRSARSWLYRRVRFRSLDARKGRRSGHVAAGGLFSEQALSSPRTGPPTAALREETYEALRAHLAALTDEHSEVLVLRYFEGMRRREIAELLGLPESIVKSRLYEASRKLRADWEIE